MAINKDGYLVLWGNGNNGLMGLNSTSAGTFPSLLRSPVTSGGLSSPVQVGTSSWTMVSSSSYSSFVSAIRSDGALFQWGMNLSGNLGNIPTGSFTLPGNIVWPYPIKIGNESWISVSSGGSHTAALKSDYTLWSWGSNIFGQLGKGTDGYIADSIPTQVGTSSWSLLSSSMRFNSAVLKFEP
jgi:alpha-tubulin suppressor-like RCC1 family protein